MTDTVWLKDKEVGKRFGSTRQWVWEMARTHPKFPQPVKLTTRWTRWSLKEIEKFEAVMLENKCDQYNPFDDDPFHDDPFHDLEGPMVKDPPKSKGKKCEIDFLIEVANGNYVEDPSEIKAAQARLDEMVLDSEERRRACAGPL